MFITCLSVCLSVCVHEGSLPAAPAALSGGALSGVCAPVCLVQLRVSLSLPWWHAGSRMHQ